MVTLEILILMLQTIIPKDISVVEIDRSEQLTLCLFLLQECGMNKEENIAIASTLVNTATIKKITIKQCLNERTSHWMNYKRVLSRLKERSRTDILKKYEYACVSIKNTNKYTHYLRDHEKPQWRKRVKWIKKIGSHTFGTAYWTGIRWIRSNNGI